MIKVCCRAQAAADRDVTLGMLLALEESRALFLDEAAWIYFQSCVASITEDDLL